MKKTKSKIFSAILAFTIATATLLMPDSSMKALAAGESFSSPIGINADYNFNFESDWRTLKTDQVEYYKVEIPVNGQFTFLIEQKNASMIHVNVRNAQNLNPTSAVLHDSFGGANYADTVTIGSSTGNLSAGTYYITVELNNGQNVKYGKDYASYKLQTSFVADIKNSKITKIKTPGKKTANVTFKTVSGVDGYEIQYSTDKNFIKNVKVKSINNTSKILKKKTKTVTLKKLKKNKNCYFQIRTYIMKDNIKYYSIWSSTKKAKIK